MHRFPRIVVCAVVIVAACAAGALGAITASFAPVSISAAAIAEDPVLATMQTWDLIVTTDGDWASAGMRLTLPTGQNFYNHAFGGNTRPNPALVSAFAGLAYDTYVTGPGDTGASGAPVILGGYPETEPLSMSGNHLSVSWGDLVPDPPGTYPIVRMTFPQGALPVGQIITSQVNPASDVTLMVPPPEPAALGVFATSAALLVTRARARSPHPVR